MVVIRPEQGVDRCRPIAVSHGARRGRLLRGRHPQLSQPAPGRQRARRQQLRDHHRLLVNVRSAEPLGRNAAGRDKPLAGEMSAASMHGWWRRAAAVPRQRMIEA